MTAMTSPDPSTRHDQPIDLSIVIPAYREADTIESTLDRLADWLDSHDYGQTEVIVVVADSPDGTAALARSRADRLPRFRLVEPGPRVGKGRDVRAGLVEATGRYRMFMDADLATPLRHLDDVARLMASGADLGIAVRKLSVIHPQLGRRVMSEVGNVLAQLILLPGIKDTQCGFKVFRADVAEALCRRQTITGWGFDLELLAIARLLNYRIVSFAAPDWADPKEHGAGLVSDSTRGVALQTLRDMVRIRLNLWRGRYR